MIITFSVLLAIGIAAIVSVLRSRLAAPRRNDHPEALEALDVRPALEEALGLYVAGNADTARLQALAQSHSKETVESLFAFLSAIDGEDRLRLCDLALRLGLVEQWCEDAKSRKLERRREGYARLAEVFRYEPVRRLSEQFFAHAFADSDEQIRLTVLHAVARTGRPRQVAVVFEAALGESNVNRLSLAAELRPHGMELCTTVVPKALQDSQPQNVLAALEIVESWDCMLNLEDLSGLARHVDGSIREKVMTLLQRVPTTWENLNALLMGLDDEVASVRTAAVVTAAAQNIQSAIPALQRCLTHGDERLGLAAAEALSSLSGVSTEEKEAEPLDIAPRFSGV